jgi:precorrin-2/cobalt-factor-2 C20-methyltransferase
MTGRFIGVGVGPGPAGYLTVAALKELQAADVILMPRGKDSEQSLAGQCLAGLDIPLERMEEIVYGMEVEVQGLRRHYDSLAENIADRLRQGQNVAYLTLGDALTYSTYGYALQSLLELMPDLEHKTYPGVTSFAAVASAVGWPLGQGKERTLILPCPDDAAALRADIESHDIVVLMKIGQRMAMVLQVLHDMKIAEHCAFASRIGLPGELICPDVSAVAAGSPHDYFTTMLIRKNPPRFAQAAKAAETTEHTEHTKSAPEKIEKIGSKK